MRKPLSVTITTVLFDLGGVLTNDVFENILYDRSYGLAPRGWLARRSWRRAALLTWDRYAIDPSATEAAFWTAFSSLTRAEVTPAQARAALSHTLRITHDATALVTALRAAGLRIGLISDNTTFWYPEQIKALGIAETVDPGLVFLSYQEATQKKNHLYRTAATRLDPRATLVVEDRPAYRRAARQAGFRVAPYRFAKGTLKAALRAHGVVL